MGTESVNDMTPENSVQKGEGNDKTLADTAAWGPDDKDIWTRPSRSLIGSMLCRAALSPTRLQTARVPPALGT